MKKRCFIIGIFFGLYMLNAQPATFTIDQFQNNSDIFLSSIHLITIDPNGKITIGGEKKRNRLVTGTLINEMITIKDSSGFPGCAIMHSQDEFNAYCTFDSSLSVLPEGHDGGLSVLEWQRNKFKQNVFINNLERKTEFANLLFNADCYLKKMILDKKLLRVKGMESFAGYVYMDYLSRANKKEIGYRSMYETIFCFLPDTIEMRNSNGMKELVKVKFKLVPFEEYKEGTIRKVPHEWAKKFNKNYYALTNKHPDLKNIEDVFKLYYVIKNYPNNKNPINRAFLENAINPVPENIKSVKFVDLIEVPMPLYFKPNRMLSIWVILSGAITFDYSGAKIIGR